MRESRILVTLDLDFANPVRFPPTPTDGIIVVRLPRPILAVMQDTLQRAMPALESRDLGGALWIVESGRIRTYRPDDD